MDVGWVAPGLPLLHLKGMRVMMFQLSGFYFRGLGISLGFKGSGASGFRDFIKVPIGVPDLYPQMVA